MRALYAPIQRNHDRLSTGIPSADALVIVTEWREFRSPDFAELRSRLRRPVIIDGRNLYDPELMAELGFDYTGIGRAQPKRVKAADSAGEPPFRALVA
jgi:UDP-N-acetyl-D-mannosaminuronate dehydrogenase